MAEAARQTLDILYDISQLLNTKLDREQLAACVALIEGGANPEALAAVVKDLRRNAEGVGHGVASGSSTAQSGHGAGAGTYWR